MMFIADSSNLDLRLGLLAAVLLAAALTTVGLAGCTNPTIARTNSIDPRASYAAGVPTQGRCEGLPRVAIAAQADSVKCVALIDNQLMFPRGVISLGNRLLVVDKGSNLFSPQRATNTGRIFAYEQLATPNNHGKDSEQVFEKHLLIENLDHPNGIAVWRQGSRRFVFVSTPTTIWRFNPDATVPADTLEAVIRHLPTGGWHYLTQIHIHANNLYVSIPSATDHCEAGDPRAIAVQYPCSENGLTRTDRQQTAVLRLYKLGPDGSVESGFSLLAQGLRDALAIATDPETMRVWVADNAWDQIDLRPYSQPVGDNLVSADSDGLSYPHDELNLLTQQAHYGWPYCHSDNRLTPLYAASGVSCAHYRAPRILLPAHAAPLGMTYRSKQLLVNLHGFQPAGRKTIYYDLDISGLPTTDARTLIDWNFQHAPGYFFGRPFGITAHGPDSVVITDDWNHALMVVVLN